MHGLSSSLGRVEREGKRMQCVQDCSIHAVPPIHHSHQLMYYVQNSLNLLGPWMSIKHKDRLYVDLSILYHGPGEAH
jgi:hypothetical protein